MQSTTRGVIFLPAMLLALGMSASAYAQNVRSWVSGEGNDANSCTRSAPCKTFDRALSQTLGGGEIDVLDPGDFGGLVINKSITIDGGAAGGIAGTSGIVIQEGAGKVILRNLNWNGFGVEGTAIDFQAGDILIIENSTITDFFDSGIKLTNVRKCLLEVRNVQIEHIGGGNGTVFYLGVGVNILGGKATVFLRKISITSTGYGIVSTPSSEIFLTQSDLINNLVATSGYYFTTFFDNHFVGNQSDGVLSQ